MFPNKQMSIQCCLYRSNVYIAPQHLRYLPSYARFAIETKESKERYVSFGDSRSYQNTKIRGLNDG